MEIRTILIFKTCENHELMVKKIDRYENLSFFQLTGFYFHSRCTYRRTSWKSVELSDLKRFIKVC